MHPEIISRSILSLLVSMWIVETILWVVGCNYFHRFGTSDTCSYYQDVVANGSNTHRLLTPGMPSRNLRSWHQWNFPPWKCYSTCASACLDCIFWAFSCLICGLQFYFSVPYFGFQKCVGGTDTGGFLESTKHQKGWHVACRSGFYYAVGILQI